VAKPPKTRRPPATTPEQRNNQLTTLAYDLVEQRMLEGVASAQETVHFLKMGSPREQLEQERIRKDVELQQAKIEAMQSAVFMEELYTKAIDALRGYKGQDELAIEAPQNDEDAY
jgi:hypothetical protein